MGHAPQNSGSAYTPGPSTDKLESWFSIIRLLLPYLVKPLLTGVALCISSQTQFLANHPKFDMESFWISLICTIGFKANDY